MKHPIAILILSIVLNFPSAAGEDLDRSDMLSRSLKERVFIFQESDKADRELKIILRDLGRLEEAHDVNPGIPGPAETAFQEGKRDLINRFHSLGEGRNQALADFFENPENEYRLKESALGLFRQTYDKKSQDHPMLRTIRRDLQRVSDSNFEYRGNMVVHSIILLNHLGDERDLPMLEALSRSGNFGLDWNCSLAIEQIKARATSDRESKRLFGIGGGVWLLIGGILISLCLVVVSGLRRRRLGLG